MNRTETVNGSDARWIANGLYLVVNAETHASRNSSYRLGNDRQISENKSQGWSTSTNRRAGSQCLIENVEDETRDDAKPSLVD